MKTLTDHRDRRNIAAHCVGVPLIALALCLAARPTATWLGAGSGLLVVGWIIQFAGHWYEGRKPAFVDAVLGLVIGPVRGGVSAGRA